MQNGNMKSTMLSSDIDVSQPIILKDALKVLVGPITRSRVKKLKETFNGLI
jgi:hypothetical protein